MNKQKLVRFINKYYLNGIVNSVVLSSKSDSQQLSARFISGDKNLLGDLTMDKWNFEDSNIGVYNTEQLIKLLDVLDEDVNLTLTKSGDKALSLKVNDGSSSINYMLSDTSIINEPPQMSVDVTPQFINKFIAGKGALAEADNFTVLTDGTNTKIVIGYAVTNTNRVTIPVTTSRVSDIDKVSFSASMFREILIANKECESATLEISSQGLSKINFKVDDYTSTYWLVGTSEIN